MSFPLPVSCVTLPGEIPIASRPIVTHSHAPSLHFLWSILESVQEEKHMHASRSHTHTYIHHTLSVFHAQTHADTHANVKRARKK